MANLRVQKYKVKLLILEIKLLISYFAVISSKIAWNQVKTGLLPFRISQNLIKFAQIKVNFSFRPFDFNVKVILIHFIHFYHAVPALYTSFLDFFWP